jgi:hypothetical protein
MLDDRQFNPGRLQGMTTPPSDLQLTHFLLALAAKLPDPNPNPSVGQSVHSILQKGGFCEETSIRCLCGVPIADDGEPLIICHYCTRALHAGCVSRLGRHEDSNYQCPFCQFRLSNLDPLKHLHGWLGDLHSAVNDIAGYFELSEQVLRKFRVSALETNRREGAFASQYRSEPIERGVTASVTEMAAQGQRISDRLHTIQSGPL